MAFRIKPTTAADSYKFGHRPAYPKLSTHVYSNWTPRSVKHLMVPDKYKTNMIITAGSQSIIKDMYEMWQDEFFNVIDAHEVTEVKTVYVDNVPMPVVTTKLETFDEMLAKFSARIAPFAGANYSIDHLKELHAYGKLPLVIKTLPEGSRVKVGTPVLTVENTDARFFWLTNYIESYLSTELWKISTSATIADYYRKIGTYWYEKTGGDKEFLDFAFHDFSYRGMSGSMDAVKSGAGHLFSFLGSDTVPAADYLAYFYKGDETFVAASIPATEHSVQTAYKDDMTYIKRIITEVYPTGLVSVVADGYDYWNVLTNILPTLKETILARPVNEMGMSKVVIRPDSGDPVRIIAGYTAMEFDTEAGAKRHFYSTQDSASSSSETEVYIINGVFHTLRVNTWLDGSIESINFEKSNLTEEEVKGSIQVLWEIFGGTVNDKDYKKLDSHIGLIYGDSITLARADEILERLEAKGFSADNVVFGVGSYTYQYNTRDTLGFAMKATNITIDGKDVALWKDPKTDDGTKKSAKGLLAVIEEVDDDMNSVYVLQNDVTREMESSSHNALTTLFDNGVFTKFDTLAEIRTRLRESAPY